MANSSQESQVKMQIQNPRLAAKELSLLWKISSTICPQGDERFGPQAKSMPRFLTLLADTLSIVLE